MAKRALAIGHGATPITLRQCAAMNFRRKVEGELGTPNDAIAWLRSYKA